MLANIYLNEFDRFVRHSIKPSSYVRYGDDFVLMAASMAQARYFQSMAGDFLQTELGLRLHSKNNIIVPAKLGIHFLGVDIYPTGRRLNKSNHARYLEKLSYQNAASYHGLVRATGGAKARNSFDWHLLL